MPEPRKRELDKRREKKRLDDKKWIEAVHFLKEVESMEKWKEIYGCKIYANLGK